MGINTLTPRYLNLDNDSRIIAAQEMVDALNVRVSADDGGDGVESGVVSGVGVGVESGVVSGVGVGVASGVVSGVGVGGGRRT